MVPDLSLLSLALVTALARTGSSLVIIALPSQDQDAIEPYPSSGDFFTGTSLATCDGGAGWVAVAVWGGIVSYIGVSLYCIISYSIVIV